MTPIQPATTVLDMMPDRPDVYASMAQTYDQSPTYAACDDVDFYRECARQAKGPILELGCGTGRVLLPLALDGAEVVGVDLSPPMLAICKDKLAALPADARQRVHLVHADMARFAFDRRFTLILAPFRGFQHLLTVEEQLACLQCVRDHLAPDGRFVLDLFDPDYEMLLGPFPSEWIVDFDVSEPDGSRLIRRSRIVDHDKRRQIQHVEFQFMLTRADGTTETSMAAFPMRCIFATEAKHLLARAGLTIETLYGDFDRSPYQPDGELIFVCHPAEHAD